MGTSAFILMDQKKYSPERLLADSIIATFHANIMLNFHNSKNYTKDGKFLSTTLNINDKMVQENNCSFIFYVDSIHNPNINFYYYEDVDLDPKQKLYQVGCIEEIYGVEELVFQFIYAYLNLNRADYFWVADYDWVYSWNDLQKLKGLPYDPDWCYKNPKLMNLS
ncbi:hypothetical protein H1Z61_00055 [Bacillus aquiflavi]|uniref:Uncharacterized protein n=1 Tax=Bacillus aquiflavi TaxID=2672567 RepID=A0A6B3VUF2_9BACI|nr:hypothetical protein [Bacillus aquiflavi]MBA4535561.1 hypothetical protein [Bacillus aquiflavi]NEY79937.1 hypothetical protein [Bacillus aquiflavi]UAC48881.1 hypothetical protein K6959_02885 [Bacillus aquiflavi]